MADIQLCWSPLPSHLIVTKNFFASFYQRFLKSSAHDSLHREKICVWKNCMWSASVSPLQFFLTQLSFLAIFFGLYYAILVLYFYTMYASILYHFIWHFLHVLHVICFSSCLLWHIRERFLKTNVFFLVRSRNDSFSPLHYQCSWKNYNLVDIRYAVVWPHTIVFCNEWTTSKEAPKI